MRSMAAPRPVDPGRGTPPPSACWWAITSPRRSAAPSAVSGWCGARVLAPALPANAWPHRGASRPPLRTLTRPHRPNTPSTFFPSAPFFPLFAPERDTPPSPSTFARGPGSLAPPTTPHPGFLASFSVPGAIWPSWKGPGPLVQTIAQASRTNQRFAPWSPPLHASVRPRRRGPSTPAVPCVPPVWSPAAGMTTAWPPGSRPRSWTPSLPTLILPRMMGRGDPSRCALAGTWL